MEWRSMGIIVYPVVMALMALTTSRVPSLSMSMSMSMSSSLKTISSSSSFANCNKLNLSFSTQATRHTLVSSQRIRVRIRCGSGAVREIKEEHFSDVVLNSDRPVLVEFVATWCGPCRLISPAIQSIAQEYNEKITVVKIDHDLNPKLIEDFKVYGLPTLILFKDGKEVPDSRREGAITKVKLKEYLDGLLKTVSVA